MVVGVLVFTFAGSFIGPGAAAVFQNDLISGGNAGTSYTMYDGKLYLSVEEVRYMNRIYRESGHEVAYCSMISADGEMTPYLANSLEASERGIKFSTDNCPASEYHVIGVIHTHPSGEPVPSRTDVISFQQSNYAHTCIQSGSMTSEVGKQIENFACYTSPTSGGQNSQLSKIPVEAVN